MPITLSKIANNTASVTLQVGEDTVTLAYYPARITEKTLAQLRHLADMTEDSISESLAGLNQMLSTLIQSWDVYEDEDQTVMFPLDPDRLGDLPIVFRSQVVAAIMRDIRPEQTAPQIQS